MNIDAIVLGAGIVGVSCAVHLQQRGLSVALVDRRGVGLETSFGNAGLVQREGIYPYAFPRQAGVLFKIAGNRSIGAHYHASALPSLARFLRAYWQNSAPVRHADIARQYSALIEHCVTEHRALAREAGVDTLLRPKGWIKVFRTEAECDAQFALARDWKRHFDVNAALLDPFALRTTEPDLDHALVGGIHFTDADSTSDPGALALGYAQYFERLGGQILSGDAKTLVQHGDGWRVDTAAGPVTAGAAVVALGPWADTVTARLGYRLNLAVKRGYHMHYAARAGASLNHPVLDAESGFLLAPMARGIRLTTGAEFARRDTPPSPVQLARAEPVARSLFPLADPLDTEPWMGMRPCTPDMMPIIGRANRHPNLWFCFGHAHHGLTLGPVSGRLIAEMMTGTKPFVDPWAFRVDRPALY